jgi:hypothetical protein
MAIIKITKEQVENAHHAREKALKEDSDFQKFNDAREKELKEALEQAKKERKEAEK